MTIAVDWDLNYQTIHTNKIHMQIALKVKSKDGFVCTKKITKVGETYILFLAAKYLCTNLSSDRYAIPSVISIAKLIRSL